SNMAETTAGDVALPGILWFLAPKPPYESIDELRRVVLSGYFQGEIPGSLIPIVYAFSSRDRAEEHLRQAGEKAAPYVPLALSDDNQLIELLKELQAHGHQHLGVDTEPTSTRLLPIPG